MLSSPIRPVTCDLISSVKGKKRLSFPEPVLLVGSPFLCKADICHQLRARIRLENVHRGLTYAFQDILNVVLNITELDPKSPRREHTAPP